MISGKQCIIFVCLSSLLFYSSITFALSDKQTYRIALKHAHKEFVAAIGALGVKTNECVKKVSIDALKIKPQLPILKDKELRLALGYLSFRNVERCVYNEKARVVYTMSSIDLLIKAMTERGINIKQYKDVMKTDMFHEIIGGIEPRMAALRVEYEALPKIKRLKIESIKELQYNDFDVIGLSENIIKLGK